MEHTTDETTKAQEQRGEEWIRAFHEGLETAAEWCDQIAQEESRMLIAQRCASTIRKQIPDALLAQREGEDDGGNQNL
ncbi:unnamed protein product [marine sediment metagenome]|uniref:Uncharacterized protein n=1 Tax=marine sediment metagenome TaxID=412755 RepID=X0TP44_9ZZZZ